MLFVTNNRDLSTLNSENQSIRTRQSNNLYQLMANLTHYQQGVHHPGIKIFNNLPPETKNITGNPKKFKQVLRKFLNAHSFYTVGEFYSPRHMTLQ
jgi:hypothetical protein